MIPPRDDHSFMTTFTGRHVWPLNPHIEDIDIQDIAHALSQLCRFGGHTKRFYSVAEHAVYVSQHVKKADALVGLLHDASEAYLVDMPRPIKRYMPMYRDAEDLLQKVIADKFGLPWPFPPSVHEADNRIFLSETRDLMGGIYSWPGAPKPYKEPVMGLNPVRAKKLFLDRYKELTIKEK
jgi:uncharacterized protein